MIISGYSAPIIVGSNSKPYRIPAGDGNQTHIMIFFSGTGAAQLFVWMGNDYSVFTSPTYTLNVPGMATQTPPFPINAAIFPLNGAQTIALASSMATSYLDPSGTEEIMALPGGPFLVHLAVGTPS